MTNYFWKIQSRCCSSASYSILLNVFIVFSKLKNHFSIVEFENKTQVSANCNKIATLCKAIKRTKGRPILGANNTMFWNSFYRLCNDKRLAEEVVRLEGLGRLVELCKNESERVGSDGVLVACLAAVRKIAAAVGPEKFKNLDATELVEPRLLDSFLIFSSRNESFV